MSEKSERAKALFLEGYGCAQSVAGAFAKEAGIDFEQVMKLASSFGGGMGRMREVCGACTGMFIIAGLMYGCSDPDDSAAKSCQYALVQKLAGEFKSRYGTIICRELLKDFHPSDSPVPTVRTPEFYASRPCCSFVAAAAEILERHVNQRRKSSEQ